MKKHHRLVVVGIMLCILLLAACSADVDTVTEKDNTEVIEKTETAETTGETETSKVPADFTKGYMKADFEAMNSPAKENGLGDTPVYMECVLTEVFEEAENYNGFVVDKDNNKWFVILNSSVLTSEEQYTQFIDQDITICGNYLGFSEKLQTPALALSKMCVNSTGIMTTGIVYYTETAGEQPPIEETLNAEKSTEPEKVIESTETTESEDTTESTETTKPIENTQSTEQPKQEETIKLSDDFIIAFVKSSLKSAELNYQDVYIDEGIIYSSVILPEGTASGIFLKDKATLDAWDDVCNAITDYSVALTKSLSDIGRDDLEAAISLVNDANPENFMFLVVNGLVLYNVTD